MSENKINISIGNSIRSLFQMIAVITDSTGESRIIDHNKELSNVDIGKHSGSDVCPFSVLCRSLLRNVHPEDREAFRRFTDRDLYVGSLKSHVHLSMECRIRHADRRYYWSEIIICNSTTEDSTEGNDSERAKAS